MKKKQQRDGEYAIKSYLKGESVTAIAQKLGYSRPWVYKWIERYQATGEADHWQEDRTAFSVRLRRANSDLPGESIFSTHSPVKAVVDC